MRVAVLGSGSEGNAVCVEHLGTVILLDAGFSAREIVRRLRAVGVDARDLCAVFITHEHGDHIRGARMLARRLGVPVYMTAATRSACGAAGEVFQPLATGRTVQVGALDVTAIPVPHDAADPVCYTVSAGSEKMAYATDMGVVTELVAERLRDATALFLESNHDVDMLRNGPYPWSLKQRLLSRHGHLSNQHVGEALERLAGDDLGRLCLMHLSQTNNHESLALATARGALERLGMRLDLSAARQHEVLDWVSVAGSAARTAAAAAVTPAAGAEFSDLPLFARFAEEC